MNERLYRAREDRMFLGVLGGIALRLGIDPSLVRIAYAIGTILTGIFPLIIVYFVMAIVIPEAPAGWETAMGAAAAAPPPPDWMQPREPGAAPPPPAGGMGTGAGDARVDAPADGGAAPVVGGPAWGAAATNAAARGATPVAATVADRARDASDARTGAIVGGLVLVGLGAAFLLAQVAPEVDWGLVGPVLLIALGVILILASFRRA